MLSGHTHGGQVTFFGLPLILPEGSGRYCAGEYASGACELHVSRGIGNSTVDFRLFADPEIPVYGF
jgi:predicted MPP superfamily phosphohydrolase